MMRAAIAVLIVCAACGEGRSAGSGPDHAVPQELVAAWDALAEAKGKEGTAGKN